MPTKTKSLCVFVFRPSRRRTSSYACWLLQTTDKNGTPAAKCRPITTAVTNAQMPARIAKRCRPSQCTAELYQERSEAPNPNVQCQRKLQFPKTNHCTKDLKIGA